MVLMDRVKIASRDLDDHLSVNPTAQSLALTPAVLRQGQVRASSLMYTPVTSQWTLALRASSSSDKPSSEAASGAYRTDEQDSVLLKVGRKAFCCIQQDCAVA